MARRKRRNSTAILSGADWVNKFPTSRDTADLLSPFRENVDTFIAALTDAGANVSISATYRPQERAYLMHYAFRIAREGLKPTDVPSMDGVDIEWVHRNDKGRIDLVASKNAAESMVDAYGIVFKPSISSNHTRKLAIDMTISWSGKLTIADARGNDVVIAGTPRSGQNAQLVKVGKTYKVIKLQSDPPHWSSDGH